MQTSISDLLIRYQAHVARPKQYNSFRSIDPTKTVRGYNLPCEASYFHFNHRVPLTLLFPPVFTVNDEWLREELVYDRSRFLENCEAPSVAQDAAPSIAHEAEGLLDVGNANQTRHEPHERKEEFHLPSRLPSKRNVGARRRHQPPTQTAPPINTHDTCSTYIVAYVNIRSI